MSTRYSNLPLLAFFEMVFAPLMLRNRVKDYAEQFRTAIRWLAAIFCREPELGDLHHATMRDAIVKLSSAGLAVPTVRNLRKRLWQLWRCGHQIGYVEEGPPAGRLRKVPKYCCH